MKTKRIIFCIVAAFLNVECFAFDSQKPADGNVPATLQDYLSYAALNNAGLKAAFEQWKSSLEQIPQVKALPDPQFTYGYYIEKVENSQGPQPHKLQLMQIFPWFGTIEAKTDAASAAAKAAKKQYEAAKLKLFFEVKDAFFEYAYLASAVEIARENLELAKRFEEVARAKFTTATASHPDIIRAQVELAKIEDELRALEELRKPIVARLNAALNRRNPEMLPWPGKEKFQTIEISRAQIIELLKTQNPELRALDFELEMAKSEVEIAKKRFYPDIGIGVEWMTNAAMMEKGLTDSQRDEVILMFNLNLPIWRENYKAGQSKAKAEVRKIIQQKIETENTLMARAAQVLYDFEDSDRKRKLYGDILIPKAQELLGASETAYKAGTIDFLSLIDAQQTLLMFQLLHERAIANNQQKMAELEMLAGTELPMVNSAEKTAEQ